MDALVGFELPTMHWSDGTVHFISSTTEHAEGCMVLRRNGSTDFENCQTKMAYICRKSSEY